MPPVRLLWFTPMGADTMRYDTLGNLVEDNSRTLDTLLYDYRNLMRYSYFLSPRYNYLHDELRFEYNESGMRIKKTYNYWYPYLTEFPCNSVNDRVMEGTNAGEQGGSIPLIMKDIGGGMAKAVPPPVEEDTLITGGEYWCPGDRHSEKLYLYDGSVLLATFDKNDNVEELFVNGPGGRLATYYQNDTNQLYFFLNDHLGSARSIVDNSGQTQFYAYHPFGQIRESEGTHGTDFKFTGKERDEYGEFDFDYFGARYYDSRLGSFSSIDKASQRAVSIRMRQIVLLFKLFFFPHSVC